MIQLALYKGPPSSIWHRVTHWITCLVLSARQGERCPYSHAEMVIDGTCYSSSIRDGGVRSKIIDLKSGHWDVYEIDPVHVGGEFVCLQRYEVHKGRNYDFSGALRWLLPFMRQSPNLDYCFEIVASMLGLDAPSKWGPLDLKRFALSQLNAGDIKGHG